MRMCCWSTPRIPSQIRGGWLGINRTLVMHNDFIVGVPANDPAGINGNEVGGRRLPENICSKASFTGRGDNSGTDQAEKNIWTAAGVTVKDGASTNPAGILRAEQVPAWHNFY